MFTLKNLLTGRFKAPKSVSIAALTDDRVIAAHDKAVKAALAYIEASKQSHGTKQSKNNKEIN
jgi:hypothetical protein